MIQLVKFERRPGRFIKEKLLDYGQASISDLHKEYRAGIINLNAGRDRATRIHPATYQSFYQYFRHFVVLRFVEEVGEELAGEWNKPEEMISVERVDGELRARAGVYKKFWRLTPAGISEDSAWDDPMAALGYVGKLRDKSR